ncbi:MAG: 2-oxoisovalerate dehydrogenase, partial [Chloroflexi bacterium]|nr:2-oxoisovalerate dehydrogenase [Chloroflexota bacterium]
MTELVELKPPAVCHRLEVTDADWEGVDRDDLVRMLFLLHLIREFESKLLDFSREQLVHGPVHSSIGQEAVAAAV